MDPELAEYLDRVVERLRSNLGGQLEAVWLIGSAALDAYVRGTSDVDVVAVAGDPVALDVRQVLAAELSHSLLPCPARKLELVVVRRAVVARPSPRFPFELNINTGRDEHRVWLQPEDEPSHWFVLDLAVAREHGRALTGPPPRRLVGEVPRETAIEALHASLDWYERHEPDTPSAVLNACRALRYARDGVWSSKLAAGAWARTRVPEPEAVERALAVHAGRASAPLEPGAFAGSLEAIRRELH